MSLETFAQEANARWRKAGLERTPRRFAHTDVHSDIDGRSVWQFASSDYAGLGLHPAVVEAAAKAEQHFGTTAGGSRLTTGLTLHEDAERRLAAFFRVPEAVLFPTGFQTNVSVLQAITDREATIFSDELNHASIIDGTRIAPAAVHVFAHNDYAQLDALLGSTPGRKIVVSDAVFSMTGEVIDIAALRAVCRQHQAWLVLDDAHGVGCIGHQGRGTASITSSPLGEREPFIDVDSEVVIGTASKALGGVGGFVLCGPQLAHLLRNKARSFVFSTANTPASTAALIAALDVLDSDPGPLRELHNNIAVAYEALGLPRPQQPSAIIQVHVGDTDRALHLHQALLERGWFVPAIRYPTVPQGHAMLRLTITARHPRAIIEEACSDIAALLHK